jgi:SAM-dependent methyltransferase
MVSGKLISQALATAVELGIPDQLGKGAKPASELARKAGAREDGVYRLLRALASVGVFSEGAWRRFKLTPIGQLLRSDTPGNHAGYVRFTGHDSTWRPWGQLAHSVRTGQPAFDVIFGMPVFEYLAKNPEPAAIFDNAMTSLSAMESHAIADAYDFKNIGTLMDVAGGHGMLLATLMKKHRKMKGVLFDLPHVTAGAAATFARAGVADRVSVASGDFFRELPSGADAIIMKHIIHDWDDEAAGKILSACHRALGAKGKLLIADAVVPTGNTPHFGKLLDLEMLALTPRGRERTKAEFTTLLKASGFKIARVVPTHSPISVVEAVRA